MTRGVRLVLVSALPGRAFHSATPRWPPRRRVHQGGLVLGNHRRPVHTLVSARAWGVTVIDAAPPVIDGILRVIGRAGAVHRGGFTVYVSRIEARADEVGIAVTVIVLPDERRGAHLTAFVEEGTVTGAAWADRLRAALPPQEWPNRVVVVPRLPRLGNGKVDRARLTRDADAGRARGKKEDTRVDS